MVTPMKGGLVRLMVKGSVQPPWGRVREEGIVICTGLLVTLMFMLRVIW